MKKQVLLKTSQIPEYRQELNKTILMVFLLSLIPWVLSIPAFIGIIPESIDTFNIAYIIYCIVAVAYAAIKQKERISEQNVEFAKMTAKAFLKNYSFMILLLIAFTIPTVILDTILQQFGYSVITTAPANTFSDSIAEFLYIAFLGPICEEVLFRGLIQKPLQKHTPLIAIITSAICFGIYHGSFSQMFSMIGVGLILGYVAYKYSIKWAIVMHIAYNLIMGQLFGLLSEFLDKGGEEWVIPVINQTPFMLTLIIFAIIGIVFLAIQMKKNEMPFKDFKIQFKKIILMFSSWSMWLFTISNIIVAILLIEKIQ